MQELGHISASYGVLAGCRTPPTACCSCWALFFLPYSVPTGQISSGKSINPKNRDFHTENFRTIHKKMIEVNSVRKYLLYAIGDVLLLVIGILIALQDQLILDEVS